MVSLGMGVPGSTERILTSDTSSRRFPAEEEPTFRECVQCPSLRHVLPQPFYIQPTFVVNSAKSVANCNNLAA